MTFISNKFELIDHDGHPVTDVSYRGKWLLVYFGFTHCRVVCPRSLTRLSDVLEALPADVAERIQPLYITVDPKRDTPEVMREYVLTRYPRFVGLSGSEQQVDAAKESFRVFSRPKPNPDDPAGYDVPHTAITYLIDPEGVYATHWAESRSAEEIVSDLQSRLQMRM
jgi:protein SCO1/2